MEMNIPAFFVKILKSDYANFRSTPRFTLESAEKPATMLQLLLQPLPLFQPGLLHLPQPRLAVAVESPHEVLQGQKVQTEMPAKTVLKVIQVPTEKMDILHSQPHKSTGALIVRKVRTVHLAHQVQREPLAGLEREVNQVVTLKSAQEDQLESKENKERRVQKVVQVFVVMVEDFFLASPMLAHQDLPVQKADQVHAVKRAILASPVFVVNQAKKAFQAATVVLVMLDQLALMVLQVYKVLPVAATIAVQLRPLQAIKIVRNGMLKLVFSVCNDLHFVFMTCLYK